ncbi:hypothetical protein AMECASPLE_024754 [Ameca splendens]|uniref:Histone deacetylase n=1 Tax=Ameca splendens TaxID=208324 RepID=A0ABV0ZQH4_9TELE
MLENMSVKADNESKKRFHHTDLYASIPPTCLPIVYHPDYNITFMGLEKLHPFDSGKWGKVIHLLKDLDPSIFPSTLTSFPVGVAEEKHPLKKKTYAMDIYDTFNIS